MRAELARRLASLHAPEWRARYGSEFEALLMDLPPSPFNLADVAASIVASRRRSVVLAFGLVAALLVTLMGIAKLAGPAGVACSKHLSRPVACVLLVSHPHKPRRPCALG
jgi:spore maturation protein SpmA